MSLIRLWIVLVVGFALAPLAKAESLSPGDLNFTARQLLQIALQDDSRVDYSGLDGVIGPQTLQAIAVWQDLEGLSDLEPLDRQVVCALIKRGIRGHGSSSKLPTVCQ